MIYQTSSLRVILLLNSMQRLIANKLLERIVALLPLQNNFPLVGAIEFS